MATMLSQKLVEAQEANDTVRSFVRRVEVGKLLRVCRAHKTKGFSVVELFTYLLCCMFSPISTYMSMRIGSYKEAFSKNTLYRFCNNAGINWHKFVRLLSEKIIREFFRPATSNQRLEYFIFDDTPFAKSGKKTELVSKFFNHVTMKYERGFRTVCVRYMILSVSQRASTDDRTVGELFWQMTAEVAEISFSKTLLLILEALMDTVRDVFAVSDEQMERFAQAFFARLPEYLRSVLGFSAISCAA